MTFRPLTSLLYWQQLLFTIYSGHSRKDQPLSILSSIYPLMQSLHSVSKLWRGRALCPITGLRLFDSCARVAIPINTATPSQGSTSTSYGELSSCHWSCSCHRRWHRSQYFRLAGLEPRPPLAGPRGHDAVLCRAVLRHGGRSEGRNVVIYCRWCAGWSGPPAVAVPLPLACPPRAPP